jgi:hypothetical protein
MEVLHYNMLKTCRYCQKEFNSPASIRKSTCSEECRVKQRESKHLIKNCLKCGKSFRHYPSQNRLYCSYQCHLDSGGAFRAGIASTEARVKYGPKKDANHNEVVAEMRKYCAVYDLSSHGMGLPDGLAWVNDAWHLFDVKNPKTAYGRRGLNKIQKKWLESWPGGPVYLIYNIDEAAQFAQGKFDGLKLFKGGLVENVDTFDKK